MEGLRLQVAPPGERRVQAGRVRARLAHTLYLAGKHEARPRASALLCSAAVDGPRRASRRAATCTTAALPASCRAGTTAASPPHAAPHAAAAPHRRAWLRQPRRAPPAAVGSRRRPRLRRPRSRPATPTSSPLRSPSSSSAGHGRAPPPPAAPPAAVAPRLLPAPRASPHRGPSARPERAPPVLGRRHWLHGDGPRHPAVDADGAVPRAGLVHVLVGVAEMDPAAGAPPCSSSMPSLNTSSSAAPRR